MRPIWRCANLRHPFESCPRTLGGAYGAQQAHDCHVGHSRTQRLPQAAPQPPFRGPATWRTIASFSKEICAEVALNATSERLFSCSSIILSWRPIFFSCKKNPMSYTSTWRGLGGTGRRTGLKIRWPQGCAGSNPVARIGLSGACKGLFLQFFTQFSLPLPVGHHHAPAAIHLHPALR